MRRRMLLASALAGLGLVAAVAAHATPITYDLTLTGTPDDGTGTLTVDGTEIDNISISIAGQTFTALTENTPGSAYVQIQDGVLKDITYGGTQPSVGMIRGDVLDLNALGFTFYYNNQESVESGTVTAQADPIPEPIPLALFGIGLAGLTLARRYRA